MFKYKCGIPADYNRQGYIYFTSLAFNHLRERDQQKIRDLCRECGGENAQALLEFVTTSASATAVCMRHYIASPETLYRALRKYYQRFPKCL